MTLIIKNNIVLNEKSGRYNNLGVIREKVKDIIYKDKVLEYIDYTETTADQPWCEIKFEGENQRYVERTDRILIKQKIKKK